MADESSNPQDQGNLNELKRLLRGKLDELEATGKEAAAESRRTRQEAVRQGQETRAEVKKQKAARPAPGARTQAETPTEASQVTQSKERQARAETKIAQEQQRQLRYRQQLGAARARDRLPLRPGAQPIPDAPVDPRIAEMRRTGRYEYGGGQPPRKPPPVAPSPAPGEEPQRPSLHAVLERGHVQQAVAIEQEKQAVEGLAEAQTRATQINGRWNRSLQESARTAGIASDSYRRHGALTTEFIAAAARGQVTIRELGWQVGATIGKFAGWTAAATAVYGAAAALAALGQGAVESLDGVNQLQRIIPNLDTDKAQQNFRDLSQQYNVPIGDVSGATYEMSRVFKDQSDAALAAEVALRAASVAEVDMGTATRYLTGIVNGFQLEAKDMPQVLDQINEATNRFGGNTSQLIEGVAKAGGQFRLAGGDVQYLTALIEQGMLATGRTGSEFGTLFQRSAEIIKRPERRQPIIDLLGIDPEDHSITEVYKRAFERARGATGAQTTEIAKVLSTPQLATRFTPILADAERFLEIFNAISPEKAKDSAIDEHKRRMKAYSEQVKAVVVELGNLGSALAQSGALAPFGAMVRLLTKALELTTNLVEEFNKLPKGVRLTASGLVEVGAALALMRRFNVGELLGGGALSRPLRRSQFGSERARLFQGLGDEKTFLKDRLREVGPKRSFAVLQAARQEDRLADLQVGHQAGLVSDEKLVAANERLKRYEEEAITLKQDQVDSQERLNETLRQDKAIRQRLARGESIAYATKKEGLDYTNPTLERDATRSAERIDRPGGPGGTAGGVSMAAALSGARGSTGQIDDLADTQRKAATAVSESAQAAERMTLSSALVGGTARRSKAAWGRARGVGNRLRDGLADFGHEVNAAGGAVEKIGVGIGSLVAAYLYIDGLLDDTAARISALEQPESDPKALQRKAKQELDRRGPLEKLQGNFAKGVNTIFGTDLATPDQVSDDVARARDAETLATEQGQGRLLTHAQIRDRLRRRLDRARTDEDRDKAIAQANKEIAQSFAVVEDRSKKAQQDAKRTREHVRRANAVLKAAAGDVTAAVEELETAADVENFLDAGEQQRVLQGQRGGRDAREIGGTISRIRTLIARSTDPKETKALIEQLKRARDDGIKLAQEDLERELALARTPAESGAARQRYYSRLHTSLGIPANQRNIRRTERDLRANRRQQERIDRDIEAARAAETMVGAGQVPKLVPPDELDTRGDETVESPATSARKSAERRLRRAKREKRRSERKEQDLVEDIRAARQIERLEKREQEKAQFQAELADISSASDVRASRTADPVAQAHEAVAGATAEYRKLQEGYRDHKVTIDELRAGLVKLNQANQQVTQATLALSQAKRGRQEAEFAIGHGQEAQLANQLRNAQQNAREVLAGVRAGDLSPADYESAMGEIANIRKQQVDFAREQVDAMLQAQEAWALSGTDDPLEQARIRARYAQRIAREAPADSAAGRLQQRATARRAQRDAQNAAQEGRIEDKRFAYDMGELSKQAWIDWLNSYADSHKKNKELYRRLKREAKALADEGKQDQYGITLGDIKMPTLYEVRRMMAPGKSANQVVQNNIETNVTIEVPNKEVAEHVVEKIDTHLGTAGRAAMKSAGVRR